MKEQLIKLPRSFAAIVLCRDKGSGTVTIDAEGKPRLYYPLANHDRQSLEDGLVMALRVASSVGAIGLARGSLGLGDRSRFPKIPKRAMRHSRPLSPKCANWALRPIFRTGIFSAHQMGTARMGVNAATSAVNPNCETWDVSGLYVVDASTFPSSSGANPMITTLAIAEMTSTKLVQTLKAQSAAAKL